jgi:hypothetical protein
MHYLLTYLTGLLLSLQASQKDLLSREKRVLLSLHQHIAEMQPGSEDLAILAEVTKTLPCVHLLCSCSKHCKLLTLAFIVAATTAL